MTDTQRLDEIRARVNRLMKPWFYDYCAQCTQPHSVAEGQPDHWTAVCAMTYANDKGRCDAEFIAHAPEDIRYLLALLIAQAAQLEQLTGRRNEMPHLDNALIARFHAMSRDELLDWISDYLKASRAHMELLAEALETIAVYQLPVFQVDGRGGMVPVANADQLRTFAKDALAENKEPE